MTLPANVTTKLDNIAAQHLWRTRRALDAQNTPQVYVNGRKQIRFCSNDYLNLSHHPDILKAFCNSAVQYGAGSGSSVLISGYSRAHQAFEEMAAEFLNRERAILFNSGYHANLGVMTTLANRKTTVIADKYCHASLIDGILLSRAKHMRYKHQDLAHAEQLLSQHSSSILVTESIFSMQGSLTNLKQLSLAAQQHRATFVVDDAHGFGILGEHGGGGCDYFQLDSHAVPCLITPLGKAASGLGAIVSGSKDLIELLIQSARTYCYTTALPAAVCDAASAALTVIRKETWRRQTLYSLIDFFIREATLRGLSLVSTDKTPIKSILIGNNRIVDKLQEQLIQRGLLAPCIRPPTVPASQTLVRVSLNCMHTEADIIFLLDSLAECLAALKHDIA